MFSLTRFTGEEFLINPETIKTVEFCGDTVITLITGERLLVRETPQLIQERFLAYKQSLGRELPFARELLCELEQ